MHNFLSRMAWSRSNFFCKSSFTTFWLLNNIRNYILLRSFMKFLAFSISLWTFRSNFSQINFIIWCFWIHLFFIFQMPCNWFWCCVIVFRGLWHYLRLAMRNRFLLVKRESLSWSIFLNRFIWKKIVVDEWILTFINILWIFINYLQ